MTDLKEKWIEALRSGKYPKGYQALRSPMGFCCLGVLCDIVDPNGWSEGTNEHGDYRYGPGGATVYLPRHVADKLECRIDPVIDHDVIVMVCQKHHHRNQPKFSTALSGLNDVYGFTFEMLADCIEMSDLTKG